MGARTKQRRLRPTNLCPDGGQHPAKPADGTKQPTRQDASRWVVGARKSRSILDIADEAQGHGMQGCTKDYRGW